MTQDVENAKREDHSLFDLSWYLAWEVGNDTACLDGDFTAADLRAIADHMEKYTP